MNSELMTEGDDYYLNEDGLFVLTGRYLLKQGHCCGNGCIHCPYHYENVPEPKKTLLLKIKSEKKS